ncbi:putative uncharacterized protein DDB_G0283431 [Anastrepha obliqua]|uniref:putative uncharacterized protein DDB_G0283431 n=1 Tax=Anastrepha obliqua TaxID=95512 RepID=UPI0024094676|nr:putative uncharacterized protein DDB_G0283431 [Anastrepha obliqua]
MHVTHASRDGCQTLSSNSSNSSTNNNDKNSKKLADITRKSSVTNHSISHCKNSNGNTHKNSCNKSNDNDNDTGKGSNTKSDNCNTQQLTGILRHSCHSHNRLRNDNHPHFAIDNLERHRFSGVSTVGSNVI